jgi:hypothetical protein
MVRILLIPRQTVIFSNIRPVLQTKTPSAVLAISHSTKSLTCKEKVLDLYTTAIQPEHAKLDKKKSSKRKAREDSDSNSDMSVNVISEEGIKRVKMSPVTPTTKAKTKTPAVKDTVAKKTVDVIAEEQQYQKRVKWLKDHGPGEEGKILLEGSDTEESNNLFE